MQPRRSQTRAADQIGGAEMGYAQQRAAGAFGWHRLDFVGRFERENTSNPGAQAHKGLVGCCAPPRAEIRSFQPH